MFVRRNMERGYNAKDMNVPFLKEQAIKFDIVKVRRRRMLRYRLSKKEGYLATKLCLSFRDFGDFGDCWPPAFPCGQDVLYSSGDWCWFLEGRDEQAAKFAIAEISKAL